MVETLALNDQRKASHHKPRTISLAPQVSHSSLAPQVSHSSLAPHPKPRTPSLAPQASHPKPRIHSRPHVCTHHSPPPHPCDSQCWVHSHSRLPTLAAILIIILGGFLFRYLETDAEIEERLARVLFMIRMNSTLSSDDFDALVDHLQATGRITLSPTESGLASLVEEMDTYASGGADAVAALRREWSFSGSCFFCFASATTVGYGNYTPKTDAGKLSLVAYVMVAIPLFIQAYCDISDWTLRWLKWVILRKAARNHATLAIRVMAQQNRGEGGVSGGDGGVSGGGGEQRR